MDANNTRIVQEAYAAFQRGDIPGVLSHLADSIEWHAVIGAGPAVPFSGARHGRDAVATFFTQVGESEEFEIFDPREFVTQGDTVVALGHYRARVKRTGRHFESDFAMAFTLKSGRIVQFREFTDSAAINAAFA